MGKKKRWFGKGDPEPKPEPEPKREPDREAEEIERRAQRAEALARQGVEDAIKRRVNEIAQDGIDNEVKKVIGVIDQALKRANASMGVSYLALTVVAEHARGQYVRSILTPAPGRAPRQVPKPGEKVDIATLPPEVQEHIRAAAEQREE